LKVAEAKTGDEPLVRPPVRFTKDEWVEVKKLLDGRPFSVFVRQLISREMVARTNSETRLEASVLKLVERLEQAG
jgi:hypothetical protein